jgi:6-phosphogluconate dehydrogenase
MKIGLVGLGRMGAAMSHRLREQGFEVIGWDQKIAANEAAAKTGLAIATTLSRSLPRITASAGFSQRRMVSSAAR